jgi:hypothetical protein
LFLWIQPKYQTAEVTKTLTSADFSQTFFKIRIVWVGNYNAPLAGVGQVEREIV